MVDLGHLAFCALAALGLARQEGKAGTPYAETLFLIRWLSDARRQKRFPKSVAVDIDWLLQRARRYGATAKLRNHLQYLWNSCNGDLAQQSDLFRLTYVTETLKDQGWDTYVLEPREWAQQGHIAIDGNGFVVEKLALHQSFDTSGKQTQALEFRIVGDTPAFIRELKAHGFTARQTGSTLDYAVVTLQSALALG